MNQSISKPIIALLLLAAGCSGFQAEQDAGARISAIENTSFQLYEGDTAVFDGANLSITFARLESDSRCPVSTTSDPINCFWEGQVNAAFSIKYSGGEDVFSFVGFVGDGTSSLIHEFGGYILHLERIDPYPTLPDPSDDAVVATLRLDHAE